jgi:hypothetical protein
MNLVGTFLPKADFYPFKNMASFTHTDNDEYDSDDTQQDFEEEELDYGRVLVLVLPTISFWVATQLTRWYVCLPFYSGLLKSLRIK